MNWKFVRRHWQFRYGFAVLSVVLFTAIKLTFEGDLGANRPFFFIRLAVLLTAFSVGMGPAIVALVFSALIVDYVFLPPVRSFALTTSSLYSEILYVLETSLLIALIVLLRRAKSEASQRAEDLAITEDRLRVALRGSKITVSNCDAELRHVWIYNPPEDIKPGDILGKKASEIWPGDATATIETAQQQVLDSGVAGRVEAWSDLPAGRRYYDVRIEPQFDQDGTPIGTICAASDVTEHKQFEAVMREEEERFKQLADSMPQIVWAAQPDGYIDYWNQRWYEFTGFPEGEEGDDSWLPVVHPDDVQPALNSWYRCVKSGEPLEMECRLRDLHAGEFRWFLNRAVPVRDSFGAIRRWYGTLTDMNDYRAAIDAALKSEERFRSLVRASAQIVWTTNPEGEVEDVPEWRWLTGQTVEEVKGFGWADALHPDDREVTKHAWNVSRTNGTIYSVEYRIRLSDGNYRWFSVRGVPVRDADNAIREWVGLCVDIEDQKRVQEQMQHAAEAMAVARDAAVQANRAKSAFLANISHELRTPLNAILGYSEILAEDMKPLKLEQMVDDVGHIRSAGSHLLGLVNDLLDISKIEAGRMNVEASSFDLAPLVKEVHDAVVPLAQHNHNQLKLEAASDLGSMHSDMAKLRQIMLNLLSNACKFTQNGTVTFTVWKVQDDGHETLCLVVADTGIGIAKEDLPRLFIEFTQLDASYTRRYSGTGLGLAICRKFVSLLGGMIEVESEPGKGSTFSVRVPLVLDSKSFAVAGSNSTPVPG